MCIRNVLHIARYEGSDVFLTRILDFNYFNLCVKLRTSLKSRLLHLCFFFFASLLRGISESLHLSIGINQYCEQFTVLNISK